MPLQYLGDSLGHSCLVLQIIHLCKNAEIRAVLPFLDSETKVAEKLTILRSDDYFQTYIKVNREVNNAAT